MDEQTVSVRSPLPLAACLKRAQAAASGGEAKGRIRNGEVQVNGITIRTPSTMVAPGDAVTVNGQAYRLVQA